MRRGLIIVGVAVACSRVNPAFDDGVTVGDDSAVGTTGEPMATTTSPTAGDSSGGEVGDSSDGGEAGGVETGEPGSTGEPPATCGFTPTDGLTFGLGDPATTGGSCPSSYDIWARRGVNGEGTPVLYSCTPDCTSCTTEHPFSVSPLSLDPYLPGDLNACLKVQTSTPRYHDGGVCYWGALTIYEPGTMSPYVIGTTAAAEPTSVGAGILGATIPEPMKVESCDCETLETNVCCETAVTAATLLGFPFAGQLVLPGDREPIPLTAANGGGVVFQLFQAQVIPTCDGEQRQISWAVVPAA